MSYEQIKPTLPDPDLYPRLDSNGKLMHEWVSTDEITAQFRSRLSDENRRTGIVKAYQNRAMQLVPELRDPNKKGSEGGWKNRVIPEIKEGKVDAAGILIRGTDIGGAQNFVNPHADMPFASGSALSVTAHRKDTPDPYGRQVIGETAQEVDGNAQDFYGRISRASKYNNGRKQEDLVITPTLPGTISGGETRISPADINSKTLPFKSHAVDFTSAAFFNPETGLWTAQNLPYGDISGHPWSTTENYAGGVITGIVAYKFKDGIYVLNLDAHINRLLKNAEEVGFQGLSYEMIREMIVEHLKANARWIPDAEANIEDPENPDAQTFGNRYYLRHTANSDGFAPPLATQRGKLRLTGSPVGIYKKTDRLNIIQLGPRPVNPKSAARKDTGNYQEAVKALIGAATKLKEQDKFRGMDFHEALFTDEMQGDQENRRLQEGTSSNFAVVFSNANGTITIKIPAPTDILEGTTVKLLATIAKENGWTVEEGQVTLVDLQHCDEAISTGTAMGFKGLGNVFDANGNTIFTSKEKTPVTDQLQKDLALLMLRRHPNADLNAIMTKVA